MTGKLFLQILSMSYTASYVIIFVVIARLLLKKMPKVFSYMLWSVVLFRLICPFNFASIWSLIPEKSAKLPIMSNYSQLAQSDSKITVVDHINNSALTRQMPTNGIQSIQGWIIVGEIIWLIGIAVLVGYSVVSLLQLRYRLVGAVKLDSNIYLADHINSPFVIGTIHPRIYLPSTLSEKEQKYTILHEQAHIRRLDHIIKILAFTGLTVHWFNPLVWVAFFLSGNDMEMSCDESVMKNIDTDIRSDYSALLLSLATGRKVIKGVPLAFCEGDIKGRIKNVMNYKRPAFWVVIVTITVVMIVVAGLAVNPHTQNKSLQQVNEQSFHDVEKSEFSEVENPSDINSISPTALPSLPMFYYYSDDSVKFVYPGEWSIKENSTEDEFYVSFYNSDAGDDPVFWYSKGEAWLTDFDRTEKDYKTILSESYSDFHITDLIKTSIDGYDAIKLVFTYILKDKEYVMTQLQTVIGNVSFQFNQTYPTRKSTENERYLKSIISSIQFNQQSPEDNSVDSGDTIGVDNEIEKDNTIEKDNINKKDNTVSDNNEESGRPRKGSIKDYAKEDILQYLHTSNGKLLKQTADNFVKAYFSGDEDTVNQYLAADADYSGNKVYQINGVVKNVYDKLTHLLAKWYSASDETAEVQYEHLMEGEDSYTYMSVLLKQADDKWLITGYYFEK
jgi:Antirepressor regulating drug resistance, predicted signal transduction N-terminal membrane component